MLNAQYQYKLVEAGCDEVGRGCIAGPVVAAAVILPPDYKNKSIIDSKRLSHKKRKEVGQEIIDNATSWSISEVSHNKIDEINILNASILAMHRSLDKLKVRPEFIIVDGNKFNPYRIIIVSQIMIALVFLLIAIFENNISNFYIGSLFIIIISALGSCLMSASLSLCMGLSMTAVAASQFALLMSIRHFSRIIGEWSAGLLDYNDISLSNLYFIMFLVSFLPIIIIYRMKNFTHKT